MKKEDKIKLIGAIIETVIALLYITVGAYLYMYGLTFFIKFFQGLIWIL